MKIVYYATVITYYINSNLKGFIAYCANDNLKQNAYLSMIIIDNETRGEGLGKLLLESSISDLVKRGFIYYKLKVLKSNYKAIEMYEKFDSKIEEDRLELWLMNL